MICFVAPVDETWGMQEYLDQYGGNLQNRVRLVTYDAIVSGEALPAGTYLFSAIDRLFPCEREIAARFCRELVRASPNAAVLNDPGRVVCRYELLKQCFALKRNSYRVFRAHEIRHCRRFPVFLRPESDHTGSLTRLLYSRRELGEELARASLQGYRIRDLMIVEYCDTADASGVFRLFNATIVGDEIIPQALVHHRNWITKWGGRLVDQEKAEEQRNYVRANPHIAWLKETFELAHVEYGRIDYGLAGGAPQVWEINTNPTIVRRVAAPTSLTAEQQSLVDPVRNSYLQRFEAALEKIDTVATSDLRVRVSVSESERRRLEAERKLKLRLRTGKTALSLLHPPLVWLRGHWNARAQRNDPSC